MLTVETHSSRPKNTFKLLIAPADDNGERARL
jgi:hypothetical protein